MKKLEEINRLVEEAYQSLENAQTCESEKQILRLFARKCAEINEEDFDYYSRKILYYNSRLRDGQVETPETKQEEKPALQPLPSDAPDSLYELLRDDETSAIDVWEWFKVNFGTQPREWWHNLKKGDKFLHDDGMEGEIRTYDGHYVCINGFFFIYSTEEGEGVRFSVGNCAPYTDPTQSFRDKLSPEMQVEFDKLMERNKT